MAAWILGLNIGISDGLHLSVLRPLPRLRQFHRCRPSSFSVLVKAQILPRRACVSESVRLPTHPRNYGTTALRTDHTPRQRQDSHRPNLRSKYGRFSVSVRPVDGVQGGSTGGGLAVGSGCCRSPDDRPRCSAAARSTGSVHTWGRSQAHFRWALCRGCRSPPILSARSWQSSSPRNAW
jgi:hypothetical protein